MKEKSSLARLRQGWEGGRAVDISTQMHMRRVRLGMGQPRVKEKTSLARLWQG